jgi:hypothetical protein
VAVVEVPDEVLVQRLPDDESVFLNLATEEYYGLDASGTAMWDALTETGRTELAFDRLLSEFDIDAETLGRDLDAFVRQLAGSGLLRLREDPSGPSASPSSG